MELSDQLMMNFARIATPKKDKPDILAYGTIRRRNEEMYVVLDGSEIETPVSFTSEVDDGDRVSCVVENHAIVVTGNLSSPSASTATTDAIGSHTNSIDDFLNTTLPDDIESLDVSNANAVIRALIDDPEGNAYIVGNDEDGYRFDVTDIVRKAVEQAGEDAQKTVEELTALFNSEIERITSQVADSEKKITRWMNFDSDEGLVIGNEANNFNVLINDDAMSFRIGKTVAATYGRNGMATSNITASGRITARIVDAREQISLPGLTISSAGNGSYVVKKR